MQSPQVALRRFTRFSTALLAGLLLSSCGGGDPYAGLWQGSMTGNREVNTIVLGDGDDEGRYYMLYSAPGNVDAMHGFITGKAEFKGAQFTSTATKEYGVLTGFMGASAQVSGKLGGGSGPVVSGSASANAFGPRSFSVSHDPRFDGDADLSAVAGSFKGGLMFALGARNADLSVSTTGAVHMTLNECTITGTAKASPDGNVFKLTLVLGGGTCFIQGLPLSGVAVYRPDTGRLHAAVTSPPIPAYGGATTGVVFTGKKQ